MAINVSKEGQMTCWGRHAQILPSSTVVNRQTSSQVGALLREMADSLRAKTCVKLTRGLAADTWMDESRLFEQIGTQLLWNLSMAQARHRHTCFSRLGKNSCLTCSTQWRQSLGRHRCYNLLCRHTHIFWPNFPFYRACKLFFKCKPLIKIIFFSVKPFFPTFFLSILLIEQFLNFVPQTNAHNRWEKTICAQNNSVEGHQIWTIALHALHCA